MAQSFVGTLQYVAPELFLGNRNNWHHTFYEHDNDDDDVLLINHDDDKHDNDNDDVVLMNHDDDDHELFLGNRSDAHNIVVFVVVVVCLHVLYILVIHTWE